MTGSALLAVFGAVLAAIVLPRAQAPVTVIVSGHVVDAVAGAPVAGAQVGLSVAGPDGARRSSMTDDTGRFVIENVPPGRYYLFAMKPGFFTAGFNDAAQPGSSDVLVVTWPASAPITLTLRPHGSISGRASDDEGRAVAGAKVTLLSRRRVWPSWGPAWSWEPVPNINQVTTTATGEYRLDEVPSGEYLLLIDASGVERSGPAPRTLGTVYSQDVIRLGVGEARRADTELPVRPAFEVTFSIDRSVDGPVFVQLLAVGEERRRLVAEQWPPGDEPATFRRLPPGDYLLKAAIGDRAHGEQPFTIVDRSRDDIGVRLFPSVVISGRVVWKSCSGSPAPPHAFACSRTHQ